MPPPRPPAPPPVVPQDVEKVIFEDPSNPADYSTLGGIYRECSHGASTLTRLNRCGRKGPATALLWSLEGG